MANNPNIVLGAGQGRPQSVDYNSARNVVLAGEALKSKQEQQDRQQAMQAQQMFQSALQQTGGDYDQAVGRLRSQGINTIGIETELAKSRKATYDAIKSHYDATKSQHDTLSGFAGQITDEASWQQFAPEMVKTDPDLAPIIASHPHYDPTFVQGLMALGETGSKVLDRVQKGNEALLKGDYSSFLGNQLSTTENQEDLDNVLKAAQAAAVPGFLLARVPKQWSPNVPAMGMSWAMTAKDKTDAADKLADDARQTAKDAQDAAHQKVEEGIAKGQLGVAQGNLGIRKQELALQQQKRADELAKGTEGVKLPAATAQVVAGLEQSESIINELQGVKGKDEWLGPVAGRKAEFMLKVPGWDVPDDQARFIAQTATLKNSVIKAITGAQMSENEATRILQQVPLLTDKPNVWEQKAEATKANAIAMRKRILALSGGSPDTAPAAKTTTPRFKIISVK